MKPEEQPEKLVSSKDNNENLRHFKENIQNLRNFRENDENFENENTITLFVSKVRDEIEDMLKTVESEKAAKEEL